MRTVKAVIPPDVRAVLQDSSFSGNTLVLPHQLEREVYLRVEKIIKVAGGKWDRKAAGHVFPFDPRDLLTQAVADGSLVDKIKTLHFYPTPPQVVARMVDLARIEPDHKVLEPSAGTGNIARAVYAIAAAVELVEIDPAMGESLRRRFWHVHCGDFLQWDFGPVFDRVVMNPPFYRGEDIKHIQHARQFLKPRGRLVALCANGERQEAALRHEASHWEELPDDSFKAADTSVRVVMLAMDID